MNKSEKNVLAMVLKGYPRISETFISNEIRLMESEGADIHIISMRHPRESFAHKSVSEIKAKVDYLPSQIKGNVLKLAAYNLKALVKHPANYLKAAGLALKRFSRTRKAATIKHLLQAGYVVGKILPGSNISHLHAHFAHSPTSVAMFTSAISGLDFSFTGHAKDVYTQNQQQLVEKIKKAKFVVTCTGYNKKYLSSLAPADKPVHCVYHGIDIRLFSPNGRGAAAAKPYTIFTVARFTPKKGLSTVLKAVRILRDKGLDVNYRIIGDGDDREKVAAEVKSLGLEDCVTLLGTQTHDSVIKEFSRSDIFAMGCEIAANGDRDGIPNVVAESMAMGVPVVATNVSGIPELIEQEQTGLLVEPKDPAALAGAMERMLTDTNLRETVIPNARKKVEQVFDNVPLMKKLYSVYQKYGVLP